MSDGNAGSGPIRQWARANGYEVAQRGLIPRRIIDAYKLASGIGRAAEPAPTRLLVIKCPDGCGHWAVYRGGRPPVDDHGTPTAPGIYRPTWREAFDAACLRLKHEAALHPIDRENPDQ